MLHQIKNLIALLEQFEDIYGKSPELDNIKVQAEAILQSVKDWIAILRDARRSK